MKLGELFIELGIKGSSKELQKAHKDMKNLEGATKSITRVEQNLGRALTNNEKSFLQNSYAIGENIAKTIKFVSSIGLAVLAVDRIANAIFKANQQMINFQRQTGISLATLNKYASASASVNYNATIEGTAKSMQNLAQNLWDIRMGRGDVSPYQELAFVGGKAINVWGKSVEQVIEEVRESIKGVGDIQATNIITRMGFSPDDLLMLRMTREEFEKIQGTFLNPDEREELNKMGLELKKLHLQLTLLGQRAFLAFAKAFTPAVTFVTKLIKGIDELNKKTKIFTILANVLKVTLLGISTLIGVQLVKSIMDLGVALGKALVGLLVTNPAIAGLVALIGALGLVLDDIIGYYSGAESAIDWDSVFGGLQGILTKISDSLVKITDWLSHINHPSQIEDKGIGGLIGKAFTGAVRGIININPAFSFVVTGASAINDIRNAVNDGMTESFSKVITLNGGTK